MKKLALIITAISLVFASCVSKQKYLECTNALKACQTEQKTLKTKNLELENTLSELDHKQKQLLGKIKHLEEDTLRLHRQVKELKSNYDVVQQNYDDLMAAYKGLQSGSKKESEIILKNLQDMQLRLEEKEKELALLSADLDKKSADLEEQQKRLKELQDILDKQNKDMQDLKDRIKKALQGFDGSGLTVYEKNGKIYVSMDESLLFKTGSFSIDKRGEAALIQLAKVLETDSTINVMVEGHTDNVPFTASSSAQIKDNWDLSVMRATTVVKMLLKHGDIDPKRLSAAGRGEYIPLDSEATKEARAKNRRTEIILTPKLDALFEILE